MFIHLLIVFRPHANVQMEALLACLCVCMCVFSSVLHLQHIFKHHPVPGALRRFSDTDDRPISRR